MTLTSRQIQLVARPRDVIRNEDFRIVDVDIDVDALAPGQIVVRNRYISVDPYMRRRMNEGPSYVPAFELGKTLDGGAVGQVVASADPAFGVGDWVVHDLGWRDVAVLRGRFATRIDTDGISPTAYLGVLGMPGLTAYAGLLWVAGLEPGDTVFVSGAAGAVGSVVGQVAKARGHRVIGSTGSAAKAAWLRDELGFDAIVNYREGDLVGNLRAVAPDGIDVYFDNVGYDHLSAALEVANDRARFAMCGTIADYDTENPPAGPGNLFQIVSKRIAITGFIVTDHYARRPEFLAEMTPWVRDGRITYRETIVEGLDNTVDAMSQMFRGANTGKMLVSLPDAAGETP